MEKISVPFQFGDYIRHKGPKAKVLYAYVARVSEKECVICTFDLKTKKILKKRRISARTLVEKYELDQTYQVLYGKKA